MTKQEIITLLIKDYEWAIRQVKRMNYDLIFDFLQKNDLCQGVCLAASFRHNQNVYSKNWVKKHQVNDGYWANTPEFYGKKEEVIQSLQTRLDILKQELLIPEE